MSIPKTEIARVKARIDLLALCGSEMRRIASTNGGEFAGPCPFCGGEDRFHVQPYTEQGGRWFCRQCTGDPQVEGWRDAYNFVMQRDGIGFVEAHQHLANLTLADLKVSAAMVDSCQRPRTRKMQVDPHRCADWQKQAWHLVHQSAQRLTYAEAAQCSREYLLGRGITPETWRAWQLGHAEVWNPFLEQSMSAITLPWLTADLVEAVQYRFTKPSIDKKARIGQKAGGNRTLFGLPLLREADTLVLVEGELNAVSIWQVSPDVDVLSWGSQTNIVSPDVAQAAVDVASRYKRILLWADEFDASFRALSTLHKHDLVVDEAVITASPNGLDANDLLVSGELEAFLRSLI